MFNIEIHDVWLFGGVPMGWRDNEAQQIVLRHQHAISSLRPEGLNDGDQEDLRRAVDDLKAGLASRGFFIRRSSFTQSV